MSTASSTKPLKLTVSNFGPINEASIELRPMSVFVGPSNTGKSYMAILIYALHRFFSDYAETVAYRHISRFRYRELGGLSPQDINLSKEDIASLGAWAKEVLPDLETTERQMSSPIELPEPIAALVRSMLNNVAPLSEDLDIEIARCFGVDRAKQLIGYPGDGRTEFSLRDNSSKGTGRDNPLEYEVSVTEQETKIDASIPNAIPLLIRPDISRMRFPWKFLNYKSSKDDEENGGAIELLSFLASAVISDLVGPLDKPAYYLPADRAGVMHAHQVVVRSLIASASRAPLRRDSPMPVLSGVLGDFLERLVELADSPLRRRERPEDLAGRLEAELIRGTICLEQTQIDYPSFVYRPKGWNRDLPLMNASSMVSELAPVVLFLRYVVQPGDLLIIEEPESHLHPAMQVRFIRQLAAAVQSGIRIILTTHSEWVLEELANLVRLSELPAERREGMDAPGVALRQDEVGAWFFEPGPEEKGSVVREISLDTESATFPAGFGLVTEELYNRWAEISYRLEEG